MTSLLITKCQNAVDSVELHYFLISLLKLPSLGLCLIQIVLAGKEALSGWRKAGLVVGAMYVVIGNFLFAQTVTKAIMDDVENK